MVSAMTPDTVEIEQQLARILRSRRFVSSPRMSALLTYLVRAGLSGEAEQLKGYSVGVDVFDRPESFDPSTDSIVRVQTGRLRRLLHDYYLTDGSWDPVRIEIGKGQYAPEFSHRQTGPAPADAETGAGDGAARSRKAIPSGFWIAFAALAVLAAGLLASSLLPSVDRPGPQSASASEEAITIAVLPFHPSAGETVDVFLAEGITNDLIATLARMPAVELASLRSVAEIQNGSSKTDLDRLSRVLKVDYALEGSVQSVGGDVRVNVQLFRTDTGRTIWAEDYARSDGDIFGVQDEIVLALASELRPRLVGAVTSALANKPMDEQTAWELYLQATWTPGVAVNSQVWELERAELARRALEQRPDFGAAHAVYADKLSYVASLVPAFDTPELRETIERHARRAMALAPDDSDAVFNIALQRWHSGDVAGASRLMQRVLDLDQSHPMAVFLAGPIPYTCSQTPEGVIEAMINYDQALSSDSPVRWLTLAWIAQAYLNNGDYELATEYAEQSGQIFRTPESAYRLAALLVRTGKPVRAKQVYEDQKAAWPGLDPAYFANETIARRCEGTLVRDEVVRLYRDMAGIVQEPA